MDVDGRHKIKFFSFVAVRQDYLADNVARFERSFHFENLIFNACLFAPHNGDSGLLRRHRYDALDLAALDCCRRVRFFTLFETGRDGLHRLAARYQQVFGLRAMLERLKGCEGGKRRGGSFVINLGEVSEDVLKDGKKFYENGIPVDGDMSKVDSTVWGRTPKERSIVYAFDNQNRTIQDVGLDGLSSADEQTFSSYQNYLNSIQAVVSAETFQQFQKDPAADDFHHYRGSDLDAREASILERYKYYTGTEGNSLASSELAAKTTPDIEDINQDNTMNETEKYYEYVIDLDPAKMQVGSNYIAMSAKHP